MKKMSLLLVSLFTIFFVLGIVLSYGTGNDPYCKHHPRSAFCIKH
jgi:hypothetical protein